MTQNNRPTACKHLAWHMFRHTSQQCLVDIQEKRFGIPIRDTGGSERRFRLAAHPHTMIVRVALDRVVNLVYPSPFGEGVAIQR